MFSKKSKLLLLCLLLCIKTILPSVISSILIKTPHGPTAAENMTIDDAIIAYDREELSTAAVTQISTAITDTLIGITTKKGTFYACPDQQFFDPILQQWITAKNITTNSTFLDVHHNHCACLNVETIHAPTTKIYRITTDYPHNFFVTEQELLTHNAFPVVIGIAWLFGEGLKFAGLTIGTTFLGSYVGVKLHNRHKQKQKDNAVGISWEIGPGGCTPDPDDDENNKRKVNTVAKTEFFKKVDKHYEYYKDNIYKRKKGTTGIEDAEYLKWDKLHNDVEAYAKNKWHKGSIDPKTLKIYKGPKHAKLRI